MLLLFVMINNSNDTNIIMMMIMSIIMKSSRGVPVHLPRGPNARRNVHHRAAHWIHGTAEIPSHGNKDDTQAQQTQYEEAAGGNGASKCYKKLACRSRRGTVAPTSLQRTAVLTFVCPSMCNLDKKPENGSPQ